MAGLFVLLGQNISDRLQKSVDELSFFNGEEHSQTFQEKGFGCAWVSHDDPNLFGPAWDTASGVRVFTSGRISWSGADWSRAERLSQYQGGLSNSLILEQYLNNGISGVERHNGPALLLIWDPRVQELHLLTDHFGYHPAFIYCPENTEKCIISTFPDAIAHDAETIVTPDYVSMVEFLRAWRITPPHTYYQEIKYAGAASHRVWNLATGKSYHQCYWKPFEDEPFSTLAEATEHLTAAIRESIQIRTLPHLGPIVSYTSGGMDSRAVLFSSTDKDSLIGLNLFEKPNKESEIARQLCEAAGVHYEGFSRDDDYYPRWMSQGAAISGGMWSLEDNHFLGTREFVKSLSAKTVITACTSDWLFKGYGLEKRYQKLFGKNLPTQELTDNRVDGFLPNYPRSAPTEFEEVITQRMLAWFEGTPKTFTSDRDRLLVEDKRIRPACYAVSVSGQIMYRIFPYDTFLGDRKIADCYSRTRAEWKLDGTLWGLAIAAICKEGADIVDANFGWKVGSSYWKKLFMFSKGWALRRLTEQRSSMELATDGSWPNLSWYIGHSPTIKDIWENASTEHRSLISRLWGEDCWVKPLSDWSSHPNELFRILTLLNRLKKML